MYGETVGFWHCALAELRVKRRGRRAAGHTMDISPGCGTIAMVCVGHVVILLLDENGKQGRTIRKRFVFVGVSVSYRGHTGLVNGDWL